MIEALEGKAFPDRAFRICREKVAEFVDVTGDDPDRWRSVAPPGFAAALLFVVAPDFLGALEGPVIHGDQTFNWHRPIGMESDVEVTGTVGRVRRRGDTAFVVFELSVRDDLGNRVLDGRSTFLVGSGGDQPAREVPQPSVDQRGESATVGSTLPSPRSASRSDLVRYAAATRDWNPIHWDHDAAVAAGMGGVVVQGLLQSSWLTQTAASARPGDRPLSSGRFRYTAPLRPAEPARIEGSLEGDAFELRLVTGETTTVSGRFQMTP